MELARRGDREVLRASLEQLSEAEIDLVASGEHVLTNSAPVLILQTIAGAFRPGAQPSSPVNHTVLARVFLRIAKNRAEVPVTLRNWAAQQLLQPAEMQTAAVHALIAANWTPAGMPPREQWQVPVVR
ncbi:MAG: hypothetical protein EOP84_08920 [Verrucomicrobiaceae bacterium]|nr:MAG: hypothetical protein EOP84_08920 [Verrucomicrobiaceae bacterium]